jgi:hypothetical protein
VIPRALTAEQKALCIEKCIENGWGAVQYAILVSLHIRFVRIPRGAGLGSGEGLESHVGTHT